MKIVNIVPGFGGTFYCGNCLRDSVVVKTLRTMGHDSMLLPIYLPLSSNDNNSNRDIPVFYGAVNIFLKQNYKIFRHVPAWFYRLMDSKPILRYAAKKAGSTRATGLEEMTISMLKGIDGYQKDELEQLIYFLEHHEKPDIVHLSNALLLGLAETIKKKLKIPVVCSLQDEDIWVDVMRPGYREKTWQLMAEKAGDVDAFIAVSDYFAGIMKGNLKIPDHKIHPIHIGVNPSNYSVFKPETAVPVIGYLSRLCEENGLEILIDAFIELKNNSSYKNAKLRLTGGKTDDDRYFVRKQIRKLRWHNYLSDVEIIEDFGPASLENFFNGLTVLSVPVLKGEAFGLYQIESLASGIPVVQPALGAFPEIVHSSGGGVIYSPNTSNALTNALSTLFSDPSKINKLSLDGRNSVLNTFNIEILTAKMVKVYESVLSNLK